MQFAGNEIGYDAGAVPELPTAVGRTGGFAKNKALARGYGTQTSQHAASQLWYSAERVAVIVVVLIGRRLSAVICGLAACKIKANGIRERRSREVHVMRVRGNEGLVRAH